MTRGKTSGGQNYPTSLQTSSFPDFDHLISRSTTMERRDKTKESSRSSSCVVPETPSKITTGMASGGAPRVWDWQTEEESKYLPSPPLHPARGMDRIPFAREVKTIASIEDVPASQRPPGRSTTASSQSDNFSEYLPTPASSLGSQESRRAKVSQKEAEASPIYCSTGQVIPTNHTATRRGKITELPRSVFGLPHNHRDLRMFKAELYEQVLSIEREAEGLFDGGGWSMSKERFEEIFREVSITLELYKDLLRNDLLNNDNRTYKMLKRFWSVCDDRSAKLRSPSKEPYTPPQSTRGFEMIQDATKCVKRVDDGPWKREPNSCDVGQSSLRVFRF